MSNNYKRTFSQIEMSKEQAETLRAALLSQVCEPTKEETTMKHGTILRRPIFALAAIILIFSLSITAMAYGEKIVDNIYYFFTGGTIETVIDEQGKSHSSSSIDTGIASDPFELREDGRVYLIANGENLDITDQFSQTVPYIYECTGSDGLRHIFVIGGRTDAPDYAEFIWDAEGNPAGGKSVFNNGEGSDGAPWLSAAGEQLNLPWVF